MVLLARPNALYRLPPPPLPHSPFLAHGTWLKCKSVAKREREREKGRKKEIKETRRSKVKLFSQSVKPAVPSLSCLLSI